MTDLSWLTTPARDLPTWLAFLVSGWCFLVGSAIGSFLNVVIGRMPEGMSVVSPRSRCPKCMTPIAWYDNLPILSWLILRGRCRACSTSISPRYLFIELLVGLMAVAIVLRFGMSIRGIELFFVACVLVSIAFIDLDTWTIPIPLLVWSTVIPLAAAGLGYIWPEQIPAVLDYGEHDASTALLNRVIGGVGGLVFLSAMVVVATGLARRAGRIADDETALGWGDPLLFGALGLLVSWQLMPLVLLLASVQGIIAYPLARFARPSTEEDAEEEKIEGNGEGEKPPLEVSKIAAQIAADVASEDEEEEWDPPEAAIAWGPFLALAGLEVAFFAEPLLAFVQRWVLISG